jgi:hypothetical protein
MNKKIFSLSAMMLILGLLRHGQGTITLTGDAIQVRCVKE